MIAADVDARVYLAAKAPKSRTQPIVIPHVGRSDLADWFRECGFQRGAEIGVKEGDYSVELLERIPGLTLYSVDPWLVRFDYHDHRTQAVFDGYEATARRRLAAFTGSHVIKALSRDAVETIPDDSLDFVYIDGAHSFANVAHDLEAWSRKVRSGGIVSGHDYCRYQAAANIHVVEAVQAFTKSYRIRPWYVLGLKEKVPGDVRDRHRSFLWVKP